MNNNRTSARYTPEAMAAVVQYRLAGMSWEKIAVARGCPPAAGTAFRDYAFRHGLVVSGKRNGPAAQVERTLTEREQWGREPLPAFHPLSMAVLRDAVRIGA